MVFVFGSSTFDFWARFVTLAEPAEFQRANLEFFGPPYVPRHLLFVRPTLPRFLLGLVVFGTV